MEFIGNFMLFDVFYYITYALFQHVNPLVKALYKISFEAGYSRNTVRTYDKLAVCVELLQSAADVTAAVCVPVSLRSGSQHDDGV